MKFREALALALFTIGGASLAGGVLIDAYMSESRGYVSAAGTFDGGILLFVFSIAGLAILPRSALREAHKTSEENA